MINVYDNSHVQTKKEFRKWVNSEHYLEYYNMITVLLL